MNIRRFKKEIAVGCLLLGGLYCLGYVVARTQHTIVHATSHAGGNYSHHEIRPGDAHWFGNGWATFAYAPLCCGEWIVWNIVHPPGTTLTKRDAARLNP